MLIEVVPWISQKCTRSKIFRSSSVDTCSIKQSKAHHVNCAKTEYRFYFFWEGTHTHTRKFPNSKWLKVAAGDYTAQLIARGFQKYGRIRIPMNLIQWDFIRLLNLADLHFYTWNKEKAQDWPTFESITCTIPVQTAKSFLGPKQLVAYLCQAVASLLLFARKLLATWRGSNAVWLFSGPGETRTRTSWPQTEVKCRNLPSCYDILWFKSGLGKRFKWYCIDWAEMFV